MLAQILNSYYGYIIEVWADFDASNYYRWYPIINFGNRQSDAIEFVRYKLDDLEWSFIRRRAKDFNSAKLYKLDNKRNIIIDNQESEETK